MATELNEIVDTIMGFLWDTEMMHPPVMDGFFDIPESVFRVALKEKLSSGRNVMPQYISMRHIVASRQKDEFFPMEYTKDQIAFWHRARKCELFWNPEACFSEQALRETDVSVMESESYYEYRESYEFRRQQANEALANPKLRQLIYGRDGKVCRNCKATKNLSIDHIVSVLNGGGNEPENLQVLCRSCNSSKGGK